MGHSYDLDVGDMWDEMEEILRRVAADENTASMTNAELVRYLKAMRAAEISDKNIRNNSDTELFFEVDGKCNVLKANEEIII